MAGPLVNHNHFCCLFAAFQVWQWVGNGVLIIFALELSAKLVVFNRREFFGSPLNRIDLAAVVIAVIFNLCDPFFVNIDKSSAGADMVQVCFAWLACDL